MTRKKEKKKLYTTWSVLTYLITDLEKKWGHDLEEEEHAYMFIVINILKKLYENLCLFSVRIQVYFDNINMSLKMIV